MIDIYTCINNKVLSLLKLPQSGLNYRGLFYGIAVLNILKTLIIQCYEQTKFAFGSIASSISCSLFDQESVFSHTSSVIVQNQFHNITTMSIDPRNTKNTRSIFYRGISLKDYLRKSSVVHKNLEYPDDETILLDQNKTPVVIDDAFILSEPTPVQPQNRFREAHCATETRLPSQKSNIQLPTLKSKTKFKIHTHNSYLTDRNSTDTSFGSAFDLKINHLPDLSNKEPSKHEPNIFSTRSESKSVSRKKKVTEVIADLEQVEQEVVIQREKPHISREYTEFIKKEMMLKNRYNIQGKAGKSKGRYYNRVKSFAE